jgi:hypothetical protein
VSRRGLSVRFVAAMIVLRSPRRHTTAGDELRECDESCHRWLSMEHCQACNALALEVFCRVCQAERLKRLVCRRGLSVRFVAAMIVLRSPRRHTAIPIRPACHTLRIPHKLFPPRLSPTGLSCLPFFAAHSEQFSV